MNLGERMKANYEDRYRSYLTRRTPVIMRLDGKAFHTFTRGCEKPFDNFLSNAMYKTAEDLCRQIQGAQCAYIQSDEISILITDYNRLETQAWFDYNVQKMVSVSASIASVYFHENYQENLTDALPIFDSRVFNIPKEEVNNYFIWRQKDWERNSIFMLANHHYSATELHGKTNSDKHEMLHKKGVNWAELEDRWKNGRFMTHSHWEDTDNRTWEFFKKCPIFTQSDIISDLLEPEEK